MAGCGGFFGLAAQQRPLDLRRVNFHRLLSDYGVEVISIDPRGPAGRAGIMMVKEQCGAYDQGVEHAYTMVHGAPPSRSGTGS